MGASRVPVREALRALANEGLVTIEPRRGASVAFLSKEIARDLVEVRATLEGLNAGALTTISIINNTGNVVKTISTSNAAYSLNIQQLPAGNYFVKIEAASTINTLQFIKE